MEVSPTVKQFKELYDSVSRSITSYDEEKEKALEFIKLFSDINTGEQAIEFFKCRYHSEYHKDIQFCTNYSVEFTLTDRNEDDQKCVIYLIQAVTYSFLFVVR
ncbi:hypothetical protein ACFL0U_01450 [Pseudomonadota bacterium]